jgi:G3E family GTPase
MSPGTDIPVTILGGYLGAGKTTRINQLLCSNQTKRIGVVINDFGAVNIDEYLVNQRGESTIGLSNGCVCCTLVDGLGAALDALAACEPPIECVVIEASGVAKLERIAAYAQTWPGFRLAGVVVVVDTSRIVAQATDKYVGATVRDQIRVADRLIMSHADLTPERVDEAATSLNQWSRDDAIVLRNGVENGNWMWESPAEIEPGRPSTFGCGSGTHETDHRTTTLESRLPLNAFRFAVLAQAAPSNLLRVKGWIHLDDAPGIAYLVQAVPGRWTLTPDPVCPLAPGQSQLVVVWASDSCCDADILALFNGAARK